MTEAIPTRVWAAPWAVAALAAALGLVLASSLIDVQRADTTLATVDKEQVAAIAVAHRSEDQLNALARGVQQLADSGNPNAIAIVNTLQRNGVHINVDGANAGK
jgi:N-acetylglucosamine kinase-like BadF-type ATPase